jgi:hypothetical protein
MDALIKLLQSQTANVGSNILAIAALLAAVGTLAMATLELIKTIFRLQMRYHRWTVQCWTMEIDRHIDRLMAAALTYRPLVRQRPFQQGNTQLSELILLAAGGHDFANALFDQSVEKMLGQIQAAVNVAMDFPEDYPTLYEFIVKVPKNYGPLSVPAAARAGNQGDGEGRPSFVPSPEKKSPPSDAAMWRDAAKRFQDARTRAAEIAFSAQSAAEALSIQEAAKARTRLNNLIARKLDSFQNETRYLWERLNQWFATALCTGIFAWLLVSALQFNVLLAILVAIPAGIAAPFAKDVTTALASFAKKG